MYYQKEVRVKSDLDTVRKQLKATLFINGYKIKNTVSKKRIIAERGSHLIAACLGGTKGAYRNVDIELHPSEKETIVKFLFKFSFWINRSAYKGTFIEIFQMLQDFEDGFSNE